MNFYVKRCHQAVAAMSVASSLLVVGCTGDDSGLPTRYPVSGKVTFKGESIPKGGITFEPVNPAPPVGRHATGSIKDGQYSLTTSGQTEDGALPGEYKIVVVANDLDIAKLQPAVGQVHHDATREKATKAAKNLVPDKYSKGETTDLKATVTTGSNKFDFDLKD